MTTYNFKKQFQDILRPMAYKLDGWGISPNQVTTLTCFFSLLYAFCTVYFNSAILFFSFPLFFLFRMALNAIDGIMAKEKNKTSNLGALLNEIGDILSDIFLAGVFIFIPFVNVHYVWGFICLSLLAECAGLWSYLLKGVRSYNGPLGKSDRGIVLTLMAANIGWMIITGSSKMFINEILLISFPLLGLTIFNRMKNGL